jgi:hypothetical protein
MSTFFKCLFFLLLALLAIAEITYLTIDPDLKAHIFNKDYYDAMDAAVQLGRLDVVSALLGVIGVLLAIFGLIGFGYIRSKAEQEAKNTARKFTEEEAPKIVIKWLNENGIDYIQKQLKISKALKDIPKDKANEIVSGGDLDSENGGIE